MTFWHWFLQETFGSPPAVPFLDLPCTAARIVSVWLVQMWGTAEFHKRLAKDLEGPGFERCFDKMENNPQYLYQYLMWCTICKSHENKARAWGILPKLSKHDRALKWTLQWTIRSQKARNITCSASPRLHVTLMDYASTLQSLPFLQNLHSSYMWLLCIWNVSRPN